MNLEKVWVTLSALVVVALVWALLAATSVDPSKIKTPVYDYTCQDGAHVVEARCEDQ